MLAEAGLNRLSINEKKIKFDEEKYLHAPGQGALGYECRENDELCKILLSKIEEKNTKIR